MSVSDELLLGRIAVNLGYLRPDQVEECLRLQAESSRPIGRLLVEKGFLTAAQLEKVLDVQHRNAETIDPETRRRKEASLFGKLAVREGYVTQDQLTECLNLQRVAGETRTLGEILVHRGYLTTRQVHEILGKQVKRTMTCPPCRLTFTVITMSGGKNARCPRCRGPLTEIHEAGASIPDAEFATGIFRLSDLQPVLESRPPVSATCVICDTRFEGRSDAAGRVRCPSCKSSFVSRPQ